jgi:glycosyltransferase involved in cell wall biosynthesis
MPVFGRPRMFRQALFSILAQEHEDWELVIYDGDPVAPQSDDPLTGRILDLVGKDRLNYRWGKNKGAIGNFNEVISSSSGEIIYAMASDDLLSPGALFSVSERFEAERYPSNFWLYGRTISVDESGRRLGVDGATTSLGQMLVHNRLGIPSVFWSRGLMNLAGGFDPRYAFTLDYELWLRFWRYREPFFLERDLGVYRHHTGQDSRINSVKLEREAERVRLRHKFFAGEIQRARNIFQARRAYGGQEIPTTEN